MFFILLFYEILSLKKTSKWFKRVLFLLISFSVIIHALALIIRWYIGDHAPWSNAYESMVYIAFACAFSGVIFYQKSPLAFCIASIMAGISLFVAHLGFMDPQITNLVPVLKVLLVKYPCFYYHCKLWFFRSLFFAWNFYSAFIYVKK